MLFYHQIKITKPEEKNIEEKEERQDITSKMTAGRGMRNRGKKADG